MPTDLRTKLTQTASGKNTHFDLYVETASDTERQAIDLLRLLTAIVFWSMGDLSVKDSPSLAADTTDWKTSASPLLANLRVTKPALRGLDSVLAMMAAGERAGPQAEEAMLALGEWMSVADKRFDATTEIPRFQLMGLRKCAQYFRNGSPSSYQWLHKSVAKINPNFAKEVVDEAISPQLDSVTRLVTLVEQLTGRRDLKLTELEKEKLRVDNPEEYALVLELRRNILGVAKQFIRMLVRKAGGMMRYSNVLAELQDAYVFHDLPAAENWDGYIDEEGNLYTKEKKQIKGKPGFTIVGNPAYDPKKNDTYVFSVQTSMGNTQYFYTVDAVQGWKEERFEAVEDFAPIVSEVRDNWLRDVFATQHKIKTLAVICELLYWASARIGSVKNNVRGEQTFGISTIQGRHVERTGNSLVIDYVGKTGVHQHHILTPKTREQKEVAKAVLAWAKEAGDEGYVFDLVAGRHSTPPTNTTINNYFKSKGATVTVHKLRHARAATIMDRLMRSKQNCPYFRYSKDGSRTLIQAQKPTQQEAEALYRNLAKEVGKELGHTAGEKVTEMTAINNYVPPETTLTFFNDLKLRTPSWAERLRG